MNDEEKNRYEDWNLKKQSIQSSSKTDKIYFKEGDVWWCALGINIGSESFGKGPYFRRPVLIIKKLSSELCVALPITSQNKQGSWFTNVQIGGQEKWVMLYQIRTLNKKRFQYKLGNISLVDLYRIKEKLEKLLELSLDHHSATAEIEGIIPKSNDSLPDIIFGSQ